MFGKAKWPDTIILKLLSFSSDSLEEMNETSPDESISNNLQF